MVPVKKKNTGNIASPRVLTSSTEDVYMNLAAAVIIQAAEDLTEGTPLERMSARRFFESDFFDFLCPYQCKEAVYEEMRKRYMKGVYY